MPIISNCVINWQFLNECSAPIGISKLHFFSVLYLLNISVEGQSLQLAASVVVKERSLFIIRVMYFIQVPGGGQKEESLHHQVPGGGQPRHFL